MYIGTVSHVHDIYRVQAVNVQKTLEYVVQPVMQMNDGDDAYIC